MHVWACDRIAACALACPTLGLSKGSFDDRNTHDSAVQLIFQIRLLAQLECRELYLTRIQPNPVGTDDRLVLMSRAFRPVDVISTMFQDAVCSAYFHFLIQPFCDDSQQGIRLRIRLWKGVIFAGYVKGRTTAVHVIFPLHGGGGNSEPADDLVSLLTRTMCLQGAEQDESQAFAQKIVAQLGAARIRRVCTDTRPEHIGKGLRGLASAASVKLPSMQLAVQKSSGSKAVKRAAAGDTLHPCARICEDTGRHRRHHCGPAVILLDAEAAAPWLQEPQTFDHPLALMVLGTQCKCALQDACTTMHIPAHDAAHQPVVLSVCAHQLGKKAIRFGHDAVGKVAVADTRPCVFNVFRDDCSQDLWTQVLAAPVKTALGLFQEGRRFVWQTLEAPMGLSGQGV